MQALVTLVTLVRALHESLREFTQEFKKVSINWWIFDVWEADGVRGGGHVCVTEEKAEGEILAIECGVLK